VADVVTCLCCDFGLKERLCGLYGYLGAATLTTNHSRAALSTLSALPAPPPRGPLRCAPRAATPRPLTSEPADQSQVFLTAC
jgi:hypothetical protein